MSKAAKRERQRQNRAARREYEEALEKRRRFWRSVRGFLIIAVPVLAIGLFFALRGSGSDNSPSSKSSKKSSAPPLTIDTAKTYSATIDTTEGTIGIALDAANAPTSVNNFVYLARQGFYDGLRFNRAATDFVIQTGSPDNTTSGGPGYTVQAELPTAPYEIGSVAWAKEPNQKPGTAGSQFFIGTGEQVASRPLDYGIVGTVTSGLDVAQKIMGYAPASGDGPPTTDVTMTKVTITEA